MPTTHGASLVKNANTTLRLSPRATTTLPASRLRARRSVDAAQLIGQRTQLMNGVRGPE